MTPDKIIYSTRHTLDINSAMMGNKNNFHQLCLIVRDLLDIKIVQYTGICDISTLSLNTFSCFEHTYNVETLDEEEVLERILLKEICTFNM